MPRGFCRFSCRWSAMAWWQPAVGSAAMAASLVVWQVKQREWAESHTWQTAVQQYMLYAPMRQVISFSKVFGMLVMLLACCLCLSKVSSVILYLFYIESGQIRWFYEWIIARASNLLSSWLLVLHPRSRFAKRRHDLHIMKDQYRP